MLLASFFSPLMNLRALSLRDLGKPQLSTSLLAGVSTLLFALSAQAQSTATGGGGGGLLQGIMPLLLIFVVMYFLLIRPQQKRQKKHRELVSQLKRGDKVLTSGGLYASVVRPIDDRDIEIELAGKLRVKMIRSSVIELVNSPVSTKRKR